MTNVTISRGTPRKKPRNVEQDADWLNARIKLLKEKKVTLATRKKTVDEELKQRRDQLDALED